jgi:molybdopterin/thiamine biosynthesis adenylyltransferase
MRVIITKQTLDGLDLPNNSETPLNLYGIIREHEGLIYIYSIGKNPINLPLIGQLRYDEYLEQDSSRLIAVVQKDLTFYYRQEKKWQKLEYYAVDLNDSLSRTPFPENLMAVLKSSLVVIFGLGSGGSRLSMGLARAGIENFKLIDPDIFSIENISRHECDLTDLGRFKVDAIKEKLLRINPFAKVETFNYDVLNKHKTLKKMFIDASLVIGATDKESAQLRINRECWKYGIPTLYGGCYDEARGGEVLFVIPGKTRVCLECVLGAFKRPKKLGKIDYSTAKGPEDYKGEPGLNAAINFITDVAQQYAIALLLRNEDCEMAKLIDPRRNLLFIGGALGAGYYVFKTPFHFIALPFKRPWEKCSTCQNTHTKETANEIIKKHKIKVI